MTSLCLHPSPCALCVAGASGPGGGNRIPPVPARGPDSRRGTHRTGPDLWPNYFYKGWSAPSGWYTSTLGQGVTIEDDAGEVQIAQAQVAQYVDLGLATIDGVLRNGDQPLLSAIAWKGGAGTQKLVGRVCKQENEIQPGEGGPMGALEGIPLPGVEVAYEYTAQGKVIRGTVKTDAKGEFTLDVPVGATVKLTARGETKTVTIVADKPVGVAFGHQGHDPTKDQPIDPTQLPRSDF